MYVVHFLIYDLSRSRVVESLAEVLLRVGKHFVVWCGVVWVPVDALGATMAIMMQQRTSRGIQHFTILVAIRYFCCE